MQAVASMSPGLTRDGGGDIGCVHISGHLCPSAPSGCLTGALQVSSAATDMFKDESNISRDDHMDRWTWMMARMYAPALGALALGLLLMLPLGTIREPFLLRSDNGLVFTSGDYTRLVRSYGLKQEFIGIASKAKPMPYG